MFHDSWKNVPLKATPWKTARLEYAPLGNLYIKNFPILEKELTGTPPTWVTFHSSQAV